MLNDSIPNVLQRMINVNNMILDAYGERCLDINYTRMINQYRETSWDSAYAAGERQWKYQTCVEFGFFQSSNDSQQPFGNNFPTSYEKRSTILSSQTSLSVIDILFKNVRIFMAPTSAKLGWKKALISLMSIMVQKNFKDQELYLSMERSILGTYWVSSMILRIITRLFSYRVCLLTLPDDSVFFLLRQILCSSDSPLCWYVSWCRIWPRRAETSSKDN